MGFDLQDKFQRIFLAALLKRPETAYTYRFVIEPEYFGSRGMTAICGALFSYIDRYQELPKPSILADKLRREIRKYEDDKPFEEAAIKLLRALYQTEITNLDYITDQVGKFAQTSEWKQLFIDAPDLIDAEQFDDLFDRTLVAHDKGQITLPYVVDKELDERLGRLDDVVGGGMIKTGIKHFDRHFNIYPPFFGLIIGDSGKGKTWFLLHLARYAMRQGHNILFFTGEMSPDDLSVRFDGSLLGISSDLFYQPDLHERLSDKLKEKYKKLKGKLTIVRFTAGSYTVSELSADIRRFCIRDDAPTVVLIDFIDLLTYGDSAKRKMASYEEAIKISQVLQGVSGDNNLVMWATGTLRTKREQEDQDLATRRSKSGAGDIVYAIDCYLTLNQSFRDSEHNRVLILVDKFRKGKDQWVIGVTTNYARSRFCVESLGAISRAAIEGKKRKQKG